MSAALKLPNTPPPQFNTASTTQFTPANKNKRVIAFILDGLIAATFAKTITFFALKGFHLTGTKEVVLTYAVSFVVIPLLYWTFLTLQLGATPGKKMMGLRIVTVAHTTDLTLKQMLLREVVGRWASLLPLGLGYLWVSWDKERKTFHDMIAGTRVVEYK